jgi:hypothetical protein
MSLYSFWLSKISPSAKDSNISFDTSGGTLVDKLGEDLSLELPNDCEDVCDFTRDLLTSFIKFSSNKKQLLPSNEPTKPNESHSSLASFREEESRQVTHVLKVPMLTLVHNDQQSTISPIETSRPTTYTRRLSNNGPTSSARQRSHSTRSARRAMTQKNENQSGRGPASSMPSSRFTPKIVPKLVLKVPSESVINDPVTSVEKSLFEKEIESEIFQSASSQVMYLLPGVLRNKISSRVFDHHFIQTSEDVDFGPSPRLETVDEEGISSKPTGNEFKIIEFLIESKEKLNCSDLTD